MTTLYQKLRDTWLASGVPAKSGATLSAVEDFERKHHIKLPSQFCNYMLTSNGMVDGQTDKSLISFLSLEAIDREMAAIAGKSEDSVDIPFAEYSIYSHYYALRITKDGTQQGIYAVDGTNEKQLTSSFDSFIEVYLSNPETIAHCW